MQTLCYASHYNKHMLSTLLKYVAQPGPTRAIANATAERLLHC